MTATDLTPGSVLARYELLIQVAQGSIAQVWAARLRGTRGFQKIVAIKTFTTTNDTRALTRALLCDEIRLASLVHHPNVVGTLELGEDRNVLFIVMEWVHGETLRAMVRASYQYGGLPRALAVNVIAQACKALHAAHETRDPNGKLQPLIHRDLSPQNLLVGYNGTVKVADFGVAKAHHWNAELGGRSEMKRKLAYMSPEQVMGNPLDARSDVFSLGTLLYLITTGQHPFKGSSPEETVHNVCFQDPTLPSAIARDYPFPLEEVVQKALAKDPDDRFASAAEMLDALLNAEPATSERNVEQRLAQFMNNTTGEMGKNRMQLVHHAQQWVDSQRSPKFDSKDAPPVQRRHKRDNAITLSSISVAGIPSMSPDLEPSSELVPKSDVRREAPSRLSVNGADLHNGSFKRVDYRNAGSQNHALRDRQPESHSYTNAPVDTSRRSDWGAHVPPRREPTPQLLRVVGGAGVVVLLGLLILRETHRGSQASAARAEPMAAAVTEVESTLECSAPNPADVVPEPAVFNVDDLPKVEPIKVVRPALVKVDLPPSTAKPEANATTVASVAPNKTGRVEARSTDTQASQATTPRKVDAWDPNSYGGRN